MARTPFKLRSGNTTPFKQMGSSPVKDDGKKTWKQAYESRDMDLYGDLNLEEFKTEGKRQKADEYTTVPKTKLAGSLSSSDDAPPPSGDELTGTEKLYGGKKGTTEYQAEADIRHPKSKKDPIFGGGASKIQERGIKYNPEGKSMAERRLEKVVGTGEWKRMSKFQQAAHQRKIDRARLSREGAQQKRRDKAND